MAAESSPRDRGWAHQVHSFLLRWRDRIQLAFEGWRERYRLQREFDELRRRGELERTLSDNGISQSDVVRLMRAHPRTAEQLTAMMQRLGIDRSALPHQPAIAEALRAMEWRCSECSDWQKCHEWLAGRDTAETYRAFCPNARMLDELRRSGTVTAGGSPRKPSGVLAELVAERGME